MAEAPVRLLKGNDEVLLGDAVRELVPKLVGDADVAEVLTEFAGDEYLPGDVVTAVSTVSMFGSRVVVARNMARFAAKDLGALLQYLEDPVPDASLVLVWDKPTKAGQKANALPKKLSDAVKGAGGMVIDTSAPGRPQERSGWIDDQIRASGVDLDRGARGRLAEQIGDDVSRLGGILTLLSAVFGDAQVSADDLAPYLGDVGAVPPWDLTDAIDRGDVALALGNLQRMLGGGARHPLQVMVSIQTHVERMVRLDGSGVRNDKDAAKLLGMKGSSFPAKKAMEQGRKLGHDKLTRAVQLVADADIDLRGRTAVPATTVLEILVARLAALSRSSRPVRSR